MAHRERQLRQPYSHHRSGLVGMRHLCSMSVPDLRGDQLSSCSVSCGLLMEPLQVLSCVLPLSWTSVSPVLRISKLGANALPGGVSNELAGLSSETARYQTLHVLRCL